MDPLFAIFGNFFYLKIRQKSPLKKLLYKPRLCHVLVASTFEICHTINVIML